MKTWLDRDEALALLRVKPQTLYAYVSRGQVRMEPDPADSRRSLYHAEDIAGLAGRRARGRKPAAIAASAMAWGEPALPTGISTVYRGRLIYRGHDAAELAHSATLEEVAQILWAAPRPIRFAESAAPAGDVFATVATLAATGEPLLGRGGDALFRDGETLVGAIAGFCGAGPGVDAVHHRLARGWGCGDAAAERLRLALVLMADHELNASTFATRVAASTGASMAASVLAGLAALSGPRHGGAARALGTLLDDARRIGTGSAIRAWLDRGAGLPGFGHPLYPGGDPRAAAMLNGLEVPDALADLRRQVFDQTGELPNCDFALAAMVEPLGLPEDVPFRLFLLARSVGWCAHAMEQARSNSLIRPRARYDGPLPG